MRLYDVHLNKLTFFFLYLKSIQLSKHNKRRFDPIIVIEIKNVAYLERDSIYSWYQGILAFSLCLKSNSCIKIIHMLKYSFFSTYIYTSKW